MPNQNNFEFDCYINTCWQWDPNDGWYGYEGDPPYVGTAQGRVVSFNSGGFTTIQAAPAGVIVTSAGFASVVETEQRERAGVASTNGANTTYASAVPVSLVVSSNGAQVALSEEPQTAAVTLTVIADAAALEAQFESVWPTTKPFMDDTGYNEERDYYQHCPHWIQFYIEMHRLQGKEKWLDYAAALIDRMFHYTDANRDGRGEIDVSAEAYTEAPTDYRFKSAGVPAPAWREQTAGWRILPDSSGRIVAGILTFVDYIRANNLTATPSVANWTWWVLWAIPPVEIFNDIWVYDRQQDGTIPGALHERRLNQKGTDDDLTDGRGTFAKPLPYYQQFNYAQAAMLGITWNNQDTEYRNRAQRLMDFIRLHWWKDGEAMQWRHGFDPANANSEVERILYSPWVVRFLAWSYEHAWTDITLDELTAVSKSVDKWYLGDGAITYYLDGTNGDGGGVGMVPRSAILYWVELVDFNPNLKSILNQIANFHMADFANWNLGVDYHIVAALLRVEQSGPLITP